jgi:HAD superfamily hydrolase (TIGR01509 family)
VPVREAEVEMLMPLPKDVENLADDPHLHNPLKRSERMGTGWFGVVMEYDGVVVEDTSHLQRKAWQKVAEEEGRPVPPLFALQRAEGMKNDQVIKEVLCWTREPMEVRRIAERKEVVLTEMLGDMQPLLAPDLPKFLEGLASSKVPAALATSVPEARVKPAIQALGLEGAFAGIVAAEDTYRGRPDPEPYLLAAQMLGRPPARCVVVGNSNQTVEAAKECGMASVVVAGRKPLWELGAADLVVKHLSELRVINLQQLFRNEELVNPNEPVPQMELEEEEDSYEDTSMW